MLDIVLTFFTSLINISKAKLLKIKVLEFGTETDNSDDGFEDIGEEVDDNPMNQQVYAVQMYCLFQIMFYELHHAKRKLCFT